ncbi:MAG TPA: type II toxin-antitoxin system RelE/ParE family toxin [Candidatus Paceibacterota bacterium]|nr:type II toxin-antitoxin system RelE/ParE family toxin [Candidatus Paceibacterota bacterium]
MKVRTSPTFDRYAKKLHPNEKRTLNEAVLAVREDPLLGEPKKGDLEGFYIYKYKLKAQLWLLAYTVESEEVMTLRLVGPHENFYRTLKRI